MLPSANWQRRLQDDHRSSNLGRLDSRAPGNGKARIKQLVHVKYFSEIPYGEANYKHSPISTSELNKKSFFYFWSRVSRMPEVHIGAR